MIPGELRRCSRATTGDAVILHVPPSLSCHRLALLLCKAPKNTTNPRGSGNAKSPAAPTALPPTAAGCPALVWGANSCPRPHAPTGSTGICSQGHGSGHGAHGMTGTTAGAGTWHGHEAQTQWVANTMDNQTMPKTRAKSCLCPPHSHQCNQSWVVLSLPVLSIPPPTQYPPPCTHPEPASYPIQGSSAHRDGASACLCCQCLSQPVAGWQSLLGGF